MSHLSKNLSERPALGHLWDVEAVVGEVSWQRYYCGERKLLLIISNGFWHYDCQLIISIRVLHSKSSSITALRFDNAPQLSKRDADFNQGRTDFAAGLSTLKKPLDILFSFDFNFIRLFREKFSLYHDSSHYVSFRICRFQNETCFMSLQDDVIEDIF